MSMELGKEGSFEGDDQLRRKNEFVEKGCTSVGGGRTGRE